MRRYESEASPDAPDVWSDCYGFLPTTKGTYKTESSVAGYGFTLTGVLAIFYAFCAASLTGYRSYVCGGDATAKIWEYSGGTAGTLTDRTGGVTVMPDMQMAQYGNITIAAMTKSAATAYSSGANFAALAGAPKAEFIAVCSNAVLLFNYYDGVNTYNDGWWASDIGDYTTWTPATGVEAANGRLLTTPGAITGAVVLGNNVYVFKANSIYRGTYVGSPVFWQWDLVINGIGHTAAHKNAIVGCGNFIAFMQDASDKKARVMLYDGASRPVHINPLTSLDAAFSQAIVSFHYDHGEKNLYCLIFGVSAVAGVRYGLFAYNMESARWGRAAPYVAIPDGITASLNVAPVMGEMPSVYGHFAMNASRQPVIWSMSYSAASPNAIGLRIPGAATADRAVTSYLTTSKLGNRGNNTHVSMVTPILAARTNLTSPVLSVVVNRYNEKRDTSIVNSTTYMESTHRERFDAMISVQFATVKMNFANIYAEVEDIEVDAKAAGKN